MLRLLFLPPFLYLSDRYRTEPENLPLLLMILTIIVLASLTDFLDGFIARRFHLTSRLGRYLDPFSDKVVTIGALLILVLYYSLPLWIFLYYIVREFLGVTGGLYIYFRMGIQGKPNWWGKSGVAITALTVFWYILTPYLRTTLEEGHWLLRPELAVYLLAFVLTGGILTYSYTYLPTIFSHIRERKN